MVKHPSNHLERLKIEKKKNEKRQKQEKDKASRLWRATKERDKEKEAEHELLLHSDDLR